MGSRILVVDDNRIMREMVAKAVRMSPLDVEEILEAGNGQEALVQLRATWIDLVLLDINMPVMDGEKFLEAVRADPSLRSVAVVVVSTESNQSRILRLRALGAGFIHKPFRPEELVAAVNDLTAAAKARSPR